MRQYVWDAMSVAQRRYVAAQGWQLLDWKARTEVPIYLEAAGLVESASRLRALPTICADNAKSARGTLIAVMRAHTPPLDRVATAVEWRSATSTERARTILYWVMVRTENVDLVVPGGILFHAEWIKFGCETLIRRVPSPIVPLNVVEREVVESLRPHGFLDAHPECAAD